MMKRLALGLRYNFGQINFNRIANLGSDLEELRQSVRRFADEKVAPLAH